MELPSICLVRVGNALYASLVHDSFRFDKNVRVSVNDRSSVEPSRERQAELFECINLRIGLEVLFERECSWVY